MLTMAILGCVVFLTALISSYWWGFHSRFSLGSRLVDAKESKPGEGGGDAAQASAEVLEFDYVFERNRNNQAQLSAQSSPKSSGQVSIQAGKQESNQTSNQVKRPVTGNSQPSVTSVNKPEPLETPVSSSSTVVSLQAHRVGKQTAQLAARLAAAEPVVASSVLNAQSSSEKDDLKKIWGIGVVFENLLNSKGVHTFEQLANISSEVREEVRASLGIYSNRIERDEWIPQATAFIDSKNTIQRVV